MSACWDDLVGYAATLGYTVELVEYVECADAPGLLGQGLGVCIYPTKTIRIREGLELHDRCIVLAHELVHAVNETEPRDWHRTYDEVWQDVTADFNARVARYLYPEPVA